jgi:hypothetical protein
VANRTPGQWRAHGRYLSRESAGLRSGQREAGFDATRQKLDVTHCLHDWQRAGDLRLWKIIISPEFGEHLDMSELARGIMAEIEQEAGTALEWVAVAHYNTGHPHVHIALRGIDRQRREIRLPRGFIQHGIRKIAEGWCTEALGYRTRAQAMEAQRREVNQTRYTSLDRLIMRSNTAVGDATHFLVACRGSGRVPFLVARLAVLEGMGLARRISADTWEVRQDLQSVLRGMQKMADRQKTLNAGGVLQSDQRLAILPLEHGALDFVEGRILVHGEEENGRSYMMLESTDAKIYAISHTRAMQEMRHAGGLRVNTVVRLRKVFAAGRSKIEVEELGSAESILEDRTYLRQAAGRFARKGMRPPAVNYGGWLGRYHHALNRAADELRREQLDISRG